MRIVKSLIGGAVGGLAGATIWFWLEVAMARSFPMGVLLAGVGAGLGVRLFCSKDCNLLTGIVAALMSLVGIIGASYASSMIVSARPVKFDIPESMNIATPTDLEYEVPGQAEDKNAESSDAESGESTSDSESSESDHAGSDEPSDSAEATDGPTDTEPVADETSAAPTEGSTDEAELANDPRDISDEDNQAAHERGSRIPSSADLPMDQEYTKFQRKTDWSLSEIIFNSLSALIAFVLAAGPFQLGRPEEVAKEG